MANFKHGDAANGKTRLYRIWCGMRDRCNNKNDTSYHKYGAIGINVSCDWNNFSNFKNWAISNGYNDNLTIDRIDGSKGYCPSNCRWVTPREQQRNIKSNINISHNGKTQCLMDWCNELGVNYATALNRYKKYGEDPKRLFKKTHIGRSDTPMIKKVVIKNKTKKDTTRYYISIPLGGFESLERAELTRDYVIRLLERSELKWGK